MEKLISKLSDREKFCLDAYLQNNNAELAYLCSRKGNTKANAASLKSLVSRWINSPEVQAYITLEKERKYTQLNLESKENRSKESVVTELNILASQTADPKQKGEILMKLADLQNFKKQEDEKAESRITYYMQVKCSNCPIYKAAKEGKLKAEK